MPTFTIVIPGWLPTRANVLLRAHWARRGRLLKADAEMIAAYAILAGVPHASGKRRVGFTFSAKGGRDAKHGDADARLKSGLDALVKCGRLVDDSPAWAELAAPVCSRGPKRTVIVLEDVADG